MYAIRSYYDYERRLVHLELSKNEAVVTESIGEGEERKIVVKPRITSYNVCYTKLLRFLVYIAQAKQKVCRCDRVYSCMSCT